SPIRGVNDNRDCTVRLVPLHNRRPTRPDRATLPACLDAAGRIPWRIFTTNGIAVMLPTARAANAAQGRDPVVVLAADDNFAMPLAVTIRSALENLAPDRTLRIYVLDAGIKDETKSRLVQCWPSRRYQVEWLKVDADALAGVP